MKKWLFGLLLAVVFTSCEFQKTADQVDQQKQEDQQKQGAEKVGIPPIINFTEKRQLADIYTQCDQEKLICYAYIFATQTGKFIFLGKCRGYGIPYATQFSNPQKDMYWNQGYSVHVTLPQAEPNGLFKPADAHGTWVMLLDDKDNPRPVLIEPDVITSPYPLNIKQLNNQ